MNTSYQTFDETTIPLSNTARSYIDQMKHKPLLNSTSVTNIILRRAIAPTITDTTHEFTSTRTYPSNPHVAKAQYDRKCQSLFGNFLSPTQAAKSRQWKNAHSQTYLRPISNFERSHHLHGTRSSSKSKRSKRSKRSSTKINLKKKRVKKQRRETTNGKQHDTWTTHNVIPPTPKYTSPTHQSTTCTPTLPPIQHRINQEQHERSQDRRNNTQAPITSGEFYKDRRDILHRLENNHHLQLLQDRRIRMENKLEETLSAWKHMHSAVGSAMEVLVETEPTPKEGKRKYPKLLQSMERNRKRLQNMLEKMTTAVNLAATEEREFVKHLEIMKQPKVKKVRRMKVKTSRTLL
jgi:hypothetical protein